MADTLPSLPAGATKMPVIMPGTAAPIPAEPEQTGGLPPLPAGAVKMGDPPVSMGDALAHEGFLDSAWNAIKGLFTGPATMFGYTQTPAQIAQFRQVIKSGTKEQKDDISRDVLLQNIPF